MRRRGLATSTLLLLIAIGAATAMPPGAKAQVPGATAQVPLLSRQPPTPPPSEERPTPPPQAETSSDHPSLPDGSGHGRRVVYSVSGQRVWLVEENEQVSGSWLVSGRRGIPQPGTYRVYSRSRWSSASGGRVRMEYMVRFVKTKGLAVGFHAIPVDRNARPIQSEEELGQPRSRGCVRQRHPDAEHLWHWAPDGTTVNVTR